MVIDVQAAALAATGLRKIRKIGLEILDQADVILLGPTVREAYFRFFGAFFFGAFFARSG